MYKTLLCALVALPAVGGVASATTYLSNAQMDMMTAGAGTLPLPRVDCGACTTSTSSSMSANGVTGPSANVGTTGGSDGGGLASNSGGDGSNSGGGGSTAGGGGRTIDGGGIVAPGALQSLTLPANLVAILNTASNPRLGQ